MEQLIQPAAYGPEVSGRIEAMGAMATSIANRWMLGWPDRVQALIGAECLLQCLQTQVEDEKEVLANEANLRHLARREILELYEIKEAPPFAENLSNVFKSK